MNQRHIVAAVQMNSGEDKQFNLARAEHLIQLAAGRGATLVALPEMFNCLGRFARVVEQAEPIPGPTSEAMSRLARRLQITLLAGSICEQSDVAGKGYNTSMLFGPEGQLLAKYRKVHLFDVNLPGQVNIQESNWIAAGHEIVAVPTPIGRVGLSICYDLRFPELYRALADRQVELIFVPAAFTQATGRVHWEVLLRARAVENQAFVIAPNQCGCHGDELSTYGHSMIIDPWGSVLACADDGEQVIAADIDMQQLCQIRSRLPALEHRREQISDQQ